MLIKAGNSVVQVSDIKRRGGRWDPDRITEKSLVPKELGDMILKEVENLFNKELPSKTAVRQGIAAGIEKWRLENAHKSGG